MKTHIKILVILTAMFGIALALPAQVPSYRSVLDNLARVASDAPISLPSAFFKYPESDPQGQLQRGIVLYAASGVARQCGNHARIPALLAEAKTRLLAASTGLSSSQSDQKSQCLYYLGLIAEKREGNLSAATNYYNQSTGLKAGGVASSALNRVTRMQEK